MKKLICLLLTLCALLLISAVAESGFALDPARINEAAASVVILEQHDEEGNPIARASGFAAIEPGLVVTSASFIQDAETIVAVTDSGETLSVSGILGCNTDSDVAIIALEEKDKLPLLPIDAEKRVLRGSDCVVVGAQGENISVSIGNMSGFFEEEDISLIQFTAPLSVGSGGSPLFDENGNVAGITTGFYYDGRGVVQNLNFAVNITEALSLYEIIKEDEVASFSEWEITDIGVKRYNNPELPLEFYIENCSDRNITEINLTKSGSIGRSRNNGWIRKGETTTIRFSQEELESEGFCRIRIAYDSFSYTSSPFPLSYLQGKTLVFSKYAGADQSRSFGMILEIKDVPVLMRRHMPEGTDSQASNALPSNGIKIINDTGLTMDEISFEEISFYLNLFYNTVLYSGYDTVVFISQNRMPLPDTLSMRIGFQKDRAGDTIYNWTVNPEDIFGKTMRFYVGEDGKVTFEIL